MEKRDGIQTQSSAEGPEQAPSHEKSIYLRKIGRYAITRLPSLVPPMNPAPNPFKALALLNTQQWLFFWVNYATSVLADAHADRADRSRSLSLAGRGTHSISSPSR